MTADQPEIEQNTLKDLFRRYFSADRDQRTLSVLLMAIFTLTTFGVLFLLSNGGVDKSQILGRRAEVEGTAQIILRGKLRHLEEDNFTNGQSRSVKFIETDSGERVPLQSTDSLSKVKPNSTVRIKGTKKGNTFVVSSESDSVTVFQSPLYSIPSGVRKTAVILFNFADNPAQPTTADYIRQTVFTNSKSVNQYFQEVSFNKTSLAGFNRGDGDVYGWYTIGANSPIDINACNGYEPVSGKYWQEVWANMADQMASTNGFLRSNYQNIIYMFPQSACNWSGSAFAEYDRSWINGNTDRPDLAGIIEHEMGHNFGVFHSGAYVCKDSTGQNWVPISDSCTATARDDSFDLMGQGYRNFYHLSNNHKQKIGWFSAGNSKTVTTSGRYELYPVERSSAYALSLIISRGSTVNSKFRNYVLEYRQPSYFDSFSTGDPVANGVTIRVTGDAYQYNTADGWLVNTKASGSVSSSQNLLASPLMSGESFNDSVVDIKITVVSTDTTKAVVDVTFGSTYQTGPTPTLPTTVTSAPVPSTAAPTSITPTVRPTSTPIIAKPTPTLSSLAPTSVIKRSQPTRTPKVVNPKNPK